MTSSEVREGHIHHPPAQKERTGHKDYTALLAAAASGSSLLLPVRVALAGFMSGLEQSSKVKVMQELSCNCRLLRPLI